MSTRPPPRDSTTQRPVRQRPDSSSRHVRMGITWEDIDLDPAELHISRQLQRVGGGLLRREPKTEVSHAALPLPPICVTGRVLATLGHVLLQESA